MDSSHILVPLDFSEQSLIALTQSYNLSRLSKSELTLLHVIDTERNILSSILPQKPEISRQEEEAIKAHLTAIAAETSKKTGIKVSTQLAHGKIYEEIVRAAAELRANFIVMGTNGSIGIKKFIGSNALRVIREAPCPVISIKGQHHRFGCKNIVLPLDLTKETKEKVNKAIDIAKYFGSVIRVITVMTDDDEFIVNRLTRQLHQVHNFIQDHDVPCTSEVIYGHDIPKQILNYARSIDADLIMIMTQQEMNWTDLFISSSAQELINNSEIPVLSIRPMERKTTYTVSY